MKNYIKISEIIFCRWELNLVGLKIDPKILHKPRGHTLQQMLYITFVF